MGEVGGRGMVEFTCVGGVCGALEGDRVCGEVGG